MLSTSGCAGWSTPTPSPSSGGALAAYDFVPNFTGAPCEMQRKWAAHNSVHASNVTGKPVVYKAACDVVQTVPPAQPKPAAPATDSTS